MTREIKFRAWNTITESYYYNAQDTHDANIGDSFGGILNNDELVVEQYIGLHDKNRQEIYESDILRVTAGEDGESYIATVKWFGDVDWPAFDLEGIPVAWNYDANALATIFNSGVETCEVIGNIYENYELLEEDECQ